MLRSVGGYGSGFGEILTPGVDYFIPVGLRIKYAFTRAANKAPIPTEKAPEGMWYVLQQLPTGVWYYDVQKKPATAAAAPAAAAPAAAAPAAAPAKAAAPVVARTPAKSNTMLYVAGGIGAVAVLGVIVFALRRRKP